MPFAKLSFRAGIDRERTEYDSTGGWFDCDKVRFRAGLPEKIGGWQRFSEDVFQGTARALMGWSSLVGEELYALGTNLKYYVVRGGAYNDITPIRRTVTLASDPLTTTSGSDLVAVSDPAHGAVSGDFVTFSGVVGPIGGVPASDLNREHRIVDLSDVNAGNSYTIRVVTTATSSASGGGNAISAAYQINTGLDTTVQGLGWGADPWGSGGWGEPAQSLAVGARLRLWNHDNFGEDLIFNVYDGGIYYKDISAGVDSRAVELSSLSGSVDVPIVATQVLVSNNDRHVIAFGTNDVGQTQQDPLLARWSNQENAIDWGQLGSGATAGSLRFNRGSRIVRAIETQREILVFTDVSLHSFRFAGGAFTFGQTLVGTNVSLIAPNAVVSNGPSLFWMGQGRFYVYSGAVQELPCSIRSFVFDMLDDLQREKIVAGVNRREAEIIWFMSRSDDAASGENDFYVIYNYEQRIWYYGRLGRTAWLDSQFEPRPLAAGTQGYLLLHEIGNDDGEVQPAQPISAFVQSSEFEIGDGERFMLINRLIPDVTFTQSTGASPRVTVTLTPLNYPGGPTFSGDARVVARSAVVPVEQFDDFKNVRVRGRALRFRVESSDLGVGWRHGSSRLDMRPDGRK